MSYDLMVFEISAAPRSREEFMAWYFRQAEWSEPHDYGDPVVASPALQSWFHAMIIHFPAMNGPYASDDIDNPKTTDHCIGKDIIYSTFDWTVAKQAHSKVRELSIKHGVGFFDVSADDGEILFPDPTQTKDEQYILTEIQDLIAEHMGIDKSLVTLDASLINDLGIYGDDGYELFEKLSETYNIDWTGINIEAIFGNEGIAIIPPTGKMKQECSVRDLVSSLHNGKWTGSPARKYTMLEKIVSAIPSFVFWSFIGLGLYSYLF